MTCSVKKVLALIAILYSVTVECKQFGTKADKGKDDNCGGSDGNGEQPGTYIVSFKDDVSNQTVNSHKALVNNMFAPGSGKGIQEGFELGRYRGYFLRASPEDIAAIKELPEVYEVEVDGKVKGSAVPVCKLQSGAPWGIERTTTETPEYTGSYSYKENAGEDVTIYVLDSGIRRDHVEFEGRAELGKDIVRRSGSNGDTSYDDPYGHGTHVTGIIMGKTYGLAKKARAVSVRVLDDTGDGSISGVIKGIEWVRRQIKKDKKKRATIINLSLQSDYSLSMNRAIKEATQSGIVVVGAAGNNGQDACNYSPASSEEMLTVGGSTKTDGFSTFSNAGQCIDILAPSDDILSAYSASTTTSFIASGTSMASAHVTGVVAKLLGWQVANNLPIPTPAEVRQYLLDTGVTIANPAFGTTDKLVHMECSQGIS